MKTKRLVISGVLVALIIGYIISIVPNFRRQAEWKQTTSALQGLSRGDKVQMAVQAFIRDRKAEGVFVPAAVQLGELVSAGYLHTNDIPGLEGRDASVSLTADDRAPEMAWICVRSMTGGPDIVLMADGTIQRLSR